MRDRELRRRSTCEPPLTAREARIDHLSPEPVDLGVGCLLSTLHQGEKSDHVGGQNRRQRLCTSDI